MASVAIAHLLASAACMGTAAYLVRHGHHWLLSFGMLFVAVDLAADAAQAWRRDRGRHD